MLDQTHVRAATSRHPARKSPAMLPAGAGDAVRGVRRSESDAHETTNVTASSAKTTPGCVAATSTPASTGPATVALLRVRLRRAFACCRTSLLTTSGTSAVEAGEKNASPAP